MNGHHKKVKSTKEAFPLLLKDLEMEFYYGKRECIFEYLTNGDFHWWFLNEHFMVMAVFANDSNDMMLES